MEVISRAFVPSTIMYNGKKAEYYLQINMLENEMYEVQDRDL